MRMLKFIFAISIMLAASSSFAGKIAGKNTFLIQGYWIPHIIGDPGDNGKNDGYDYWSTSELYRNGGGIVFFFLYLTLFFWVFRGNLCFFFNLYHFCSGCYVES